MPTTKYKIAEQVLYAVAGGIPDASSNVQLEDVIESVGQLVNQLLKTEFYNGLNAGGDTAFDTYVLATYENIPITSFGCNRSIATLPAIPIALPRNMGVFQVSDKVDFSNPFIPLQSGQYALMLKQPILSTLMDQVGYEILGDKLITTEDVTKKGIDSIYLQLVIFDINQLDDYAPLPIPSDYESMIVQQLKAQFMPIPTGDNYSDNSTQLKQSVQ